MKRKEKDAIIDSLASKLKNANHFYLTDLTDLNAEHTSKLRRTCFNQNVELLVVKNTLLQKALERTNPAFKELDVVLKGHTSIMFSEQNNLPAKLIKDFRKKHSKPLLKAAYVSESIFIGDNQIDSLIAIKSKEELIADVLALLQSPIKQVISALQNSGGAICGVLETLSKKEE